MFSFCSVDTFHVPPFHCLFCQILFLYFFIQLKQHLAAGIFLVLTLMLFSF